MTRTSVRAPQPGDLKAMAEVELVCFADPWPGQLLASELLAPGRFHRVVVDPGGCLVAYLLAAWQYLDLHVLKVAVLPDWRRQGLARQLMDLAERHALEMGGESVTLEVRDSNHSAAALYASLGFELVGRRPAYYMDGEDALIMTKRVPS